LIVITLLAGINARSSSCVLQLIKPNLAFVSMNRFTFFSSIALAWLILEVKLVNFYLMASLDLEDGSILNASP